MRNNNNKEEEEEEHGVSNSREKKREEMRPRAPRTGCQHTRAPLPLLRPDKRRQLGQLMDTHKYFKNNTNYYDFPFGPFCYVTLILLCTHLTLNLMSTYISWNLFNIPSVHITIDC